MFHVSLSPRDGSRQGFLREISGHEEILASGGVASPVLASEIVARLLMDAPAAALHPATAWQMSIGDRDRLVAELYRSCFGDRVTSLAHCESCGRSFEMDFSLAALVAQANERQSIPPSAVTGPDDHGFYLASGGGRFRLITADDERALLGIPAEQAGQVLRSRCLPDCPPGATEETTQGLIEALDPVLALEIPTRCAECGAAQSVDFDLSRFFLASLFREQPLLLREIHWIAKVYGWSHHEILSLPRTVRRSYSSLILGEAEAMREAQVR